MKTEFAQLDSGISLEFALAGSPDAETLLFVHGLGPNLRQFEAQMNFFSQEFQVLLVSLRGHGGSSIPDQPERADFSIPALAEDVRSLLTRLDIQKVHFVGNSAGGLVGYQLLINNEDLLSSLTTFGTTAELHTSAPMLWFLTTLTRILGPGTMGKLAKASTKDSQVAEQVAEMFATADKRAIWMTQYNIADYDYRPVLRDQRLPMLMLRGEYDTEINAKLDSTLEVLQGNSDFKLVEMAGAGHFMNMEKPERFNQELLAFLRQCQYKRVG
jgi:3-oxoadipate enol-lactonase